MLIKEMIANRLTKALTPTKIKIFVKQLNFAKKIQICTEFMLKEYIKFF